MDQANEQLPIWSKVKRFQLLNARLTIDNGLLQQKFKVNRAKVNEIFATEINALYGEESTLSSELVVHSSELFKLWKLSQLKLLAKKFRRLSWKVFRSYVQHQNLNLFHKIEIDERQSKFFKFRIPFVSREENSQLQTPNSGATPRRRKT